MKNFNRFAVVAMILFVFSSSANAYPVYIENTTDASLWIAVHTMRVFDTQVEGDIWVGPKSGAKFDSGSLWCPIAISLRVPKDVPFRAMSIPFPICGQALVVIYQKGSGTGIWYEWTWGVR